MKALLRRVRLIREEAQSARAKTAKPKAEVLEFDNLILDMVRHEIKINDRVVAFKPKEYELLTFFAQHQGQVLSQNDPREVWGWIYR